MADEVKYETHETKVEEPCDAPAAVKAEEPAALETSDRGLFGFGKKEEEKKCEEEVIATEFDEKVKVSEEETKHESLLEKLQRSSSSSSSSSDEEEVNENGEKKKKKKGLKEKNSGEKKEEEKEKPAEIKYEDTSVPIEKCDDVAPPVAAAECHAAPEAEGKEEKKGFLEKIKEKIPGYHPKIVEEKEKEKEGAC